MKIPVNIEIDFTPEAVPEGWDAVEVHGVREVKALSDAETSYCIQVDDDDEAHFWSVYLHKPGAGVDCVADLPTRELAEGLEKLLMQAARLYQGRL